MAMTGGGYGGGGGGGAFAGAGDDVELTVSTAGCAAAPIFRAAQIEDCLTGLPFLDAVAQDPHPGSSRGPRGLLPGAIVEVYGASGSGKTEVALNALAAWVLHRAMGGVGGAAVVLDLDFRWSVTRLHALLRHRVAAARVRRQQQRQHQQHQQHQQQEEGAEMVEDEEVVLKACLRRVVLARCLDELEAFSVLEVLRHDLRTGAAVPVLVVVDSCGSLLYERKAAESCRQGQSCFDVMVARCLGRMAAARAVAVLALKPALLQGKRLVHPEDPAQPQGSSLTFPSLEHREYLPAQWAKLVTHRLTLWKEGGSGGQPAYFAARLLSLAGAGGGGAGGGGGGQQQAVVGHYWFTVEGDGVHPLPPVGGEGAE